MTALVAALLLGLAVAIRTADGGRRAWWALPVLAAMAVQARADGSGGVVIPWTVPTPVFRGLAGTWWFLPPIPVPTWRWSGFGGNRRLSSHAFLARQLPDDRWQPASGVQLAGEPSSVASDGHDLLIASSVGHATRVQRLDASGRLWEVPSPHTWSWAAVGTAGPSGPFEIYAMAPRRHVDDADFLRVWRFIEDGNLRSDGWFEIVGGVPTDACRSAGQLWISRYPYRASRAEDWGTARRASGSGLCASSLPRHRPECAVLLETAEALIDPGRVRSTNTVPTWRPEVGMTRTVLSGPNAPPAREVADGIQWAVADGSTDQADSERLATGLSPEDIARLRVGGPGDHPWSVWPWISANARFRRP